MFEAENVVDQVVRRERYETSHPEAQITCIALGTWQAVVATETGEQIITRHDLRLLMDELENR